MCVGAGDEPADGDAATDLDSRRLGGDGRHGRFDHGAAAGQHLEVVVAVRHGLRRRYVGAEHVPEVVEAQAAG